MGSSRLPGKVVAEVGGRPMLHLLLDRLAAAPVDAVVVATSSLARDDPVAEVAAAAGVPVVRGSESDVLDRFATTLDAFPGDDVIRVTGDCPLTDPTIVGDALALHRERAADYTSNVFPRTFPKGLDVEVASMAAFRQAIDAATDPMEREHVTPFLYRRPERFRLANLWCEDDLGNERWTVDTPEDLDVIRGIVERLPDQRAGWRQILAVVGRRAVPGVGELWLRPARAGDSGTLLSWRNDPISVRFSRTGAVDPVDHQRWFSGRLLDPASRIWIGVIDGSDVGFVRVDVRAGVGEVSIAVAPRYRGKGLASRLLLALQGQLRDDQQAVALIASLHPDNVASRKAFEQVGFRRTGEDDYLHFRWAR